MKKFAFILIFALCLPFVLVGCGKVEEKLNHYQVVATFHEEERSLECEERVLFYNNYSNSLKEVCFFLYANAFDEGQKSVTVAELDKAYKWGESYGNITFSSVKVGGEEAEFSISENKNILSVQTPEFFPGESVEIELEFVVNLARVRHRLGAGEHAFNFGNFLPLACVYENGFVKNDFSAYGDPFYSEVSNFDVTISYPEGFVLASSGKVISSEGEGETKSVIRAEKVRDFAFVLSREFSVLSGEAGKTQVNYFYYDDQRADEHLEISVRAVLTFNDLFGEYPYEVLNVVKTDFCFGGMEEPNLVMIADDILDAETQNYVIVHEIAHQWWYGVVGNNQFENAWVDEGLTEYSTALFYKENPQYGLNYDTIMENALNSYLHFAQIFDDLTGLDETMNRNLNEFATEPEYVNITYTRGMLMFDALRQNMSERRFLNCLKDYYKEYKFKNSSAEKLAQSFSRSSHINLGKFFSAWTSGQVKFRQFNA